MYFTETERTGLRPVTADDATPEYLSWLNDPEVTVGLETGIFPSSAASLEAFLDHVSKSKSDVMFAIIDKEKKKHIGNIKLGNINWVHRNGELGILIGDKNSWGKGFGKDACVLLVKYAFEKLNLHKVWLTVFSNNETAVELYKKLGFVQEGCLREHVFSNGKFVDKIIMSVYNSKG
ncbi:MAG: GNAT family N-acetyltransferase [Bacteroidetes bacterium]|nr:GNAT family N-acetyltransferase [Bacteroidota bacterium]